MQILPISDIHYQTCFKSNERAVKNSEGDILYKTTTYFFRNDTDWDNLIEFLCNKYKNTEKINVYSYGCSNGMEPYSFLLNLLSFRPKMLEKCTPVIAKDIDMKNIEMAKQGDYEIDSHDLFTLDYQTCGKYKKYFDCQERYNVSGPDIILTAKNNIKEHINFEQGDIFEDIKKLPNKNTVIFCKNFWPYLTPEKRELLAKNLSEQFDKTCTIIIGDFDKYYSDAEKLFKKNNLRKYPYMDYVWEKEK